MKIAFLCNHVQGGWKPTDIRLGGTEESLVKWKEQLEGMGHIVTIYDNDTRDQYAGGHDICINVKSHDKPPIEPTLYLTNETDADKLDLSKYDGVIFPSLWAAENIKVNNREVFVLPHGYDDNLYRPMKKIPKQCLYASSPDRGLETLLRAWPKVIEAHPDATLKVTYGAEPMDCPGVEFLGDVSEWDMVKLFGESDVWCHPCSGGELFGITGIKAQASGCVPVIIPTMALKETVVDGYFTDKEHYADTLIDALSNEEQRDSVRANLAKEYFFDWYDTAHMLEDIITEVLQ